jgi:tripartite ATP-independent transporter DctM subunit
LVKRKLIKFSFRIGGDFLLKLVFFIAFLLLLFLRMPIAFAMMIAPFIYFIVRGGMSLKVIPEIITSGLNSYTLLAIPLFVLAGTLMNTVGITRRIFNLCLAFVGHLKAGLAQVNVMASIIFAGITGSSVADVAGLGAIEIKTMKEEGYDAGFSAAVTAASSCIGPVIPPSVLMIVIGVMTQTSIGRLFAAGLIPGILMGMAMMMLNYYFALTKPEYFPIPRPKTNWKQILTAVKEGLPAAMSPVIILAGMVTGIVTPTEAGIIAVLYSIFLGVIYKEITLQGFVTALKEAAISSGTVLFIIAGAQIFGWVVTIEQVAQIANTLVQSLAMPSWLILLSINLIVLFFGCFLEGIAVLMIIVPVFLPIIGTIGMDTIQFAAFLVVNVMLGLITPPVGISVYIASDVAGVSVAEGFRKTALFMIPIVVALILTTYIPSISLFLPRLFFGQ